MGGNSGSMLESFIYDMDTRLRVILRNNDPRIVQGEYPEGSAAEHKIACKITERREVGRHTHVGEQCRLNYEK